MKRLLTHSLAALIGTTVLAPLALGSVPRHTAVPPGVPAGVATNPRFGSDKGGADDPLYNLQWGLENRGQLGGLVDTDIDAEGAWELSEGAPEILVGVLDTGVDITHPDLYGVLWVNEVEAAGVPGVDDDANGCIDDIHGCWFSEGCTAEDPVCTPEPVGAEFDFAGHGTAVAGVIAAMARNAEGGRGVAPNVRIVVLHVATPEGYFWDEPTHRALAYAAQIGVDVINISAYFDGPDLAYQDDGLSIATDSGALIVHSAGNWGVNLEDHQEDLPYMPDQSENPAILHVAAVDRYDRMISYAGWWGSCWGPDRVEVAGPSQAIVTAKPVDPDSGDEPYTYTFNGTSASSPFVAGVAALVRSVNPALTALEVKAILENTVDPVPELAGKIRSGGRVNAANAVRAALDMGEIPVAVATGPAEAAVGEELTFTAAGSTDPDGGGLVYRWAFDDGGTAEGETVTHAYTAHGLYHVTLEVEDETGMRATSRVRVTVPMVWRDAHISFQSPHPYDDGEAYEIELPERARFVRLHFDRLEVAVVDNDFVGDDDAVVLVDSTRTPVWSRSEPGENFWTEPIPVFDGQLQFWLIGSERGAWGYRVDRVQYVDDEPYDGSGCGCRSGRTPPTQLVFAILLLLFLNRRSASPE